MDSGRSGGAQAIVGAIVGTAVAVLLAALQEAEVISTATAVYVAVAASAVIVVGSFVWLRLEKANQTDRRPDIPPEMYFREDPELLHRPSADANAPYHHVARLGLKEVVSQITLEVRTNKPVQAVKGRIYRDAELEQEFDRAIASLGARRWRGSFGDAVLKSMTLDKGIRWATITFDDAVVATTADNLDVIAWGASEDLRIRKIRLLRPARP